MDGNMPGKISPLRENDSLRNNQLAAIHIKILIFDFIRAKRARIISVSKR
jgi:hypothetical protein